MTGLPKRKNVYHFCYQGKFGRVLNREAMLVGGAFPQSTLDVPLPNFDNLANT